VNDGAFCLDKFGYNLVSLVTPIILLRQSIYVTSIFRSSFL